jgi:hypothetical protein
MLLPMNRFTMPLCKISFALAFLILAAQAWSQDLKKDLPRSFTVSVSNPLKTERKNEMVIISSEAIQKQIRDFNPKAFVVFEGGRELASQYNFQDSARPGIIVVLDNVKGGENRQLTVRYKDKGELRRQYPKRAQAELSHKAGGRWVGREYEGGSFTNVGYLRVPPEHKDHSWFIRYEGPGWESDKVGYRLYLDQRNATDVFGKKTSDMVLQQVGLDGFDSYHNMQPWGMDVMKVGPTLGLGSIGAWSNRKVLRVEKTDSVTCRILENGDVYASFLTSYFGWQTGNEKYDVRSYTGIHAGTRATYQSLELNKDSDSLCTGIVKDKNARLLINKGDATHLGYLATYGKQSLNQDELGLAVFFRFADATGFPENPGSHVVTLKTTGGKLEYYFLAVWAGEPEEMKEGVKDEGTFVQYLEKISAQLAQPLKVKINP